MAAMQVEGQVLPTEEFTEDLGWRTVPSRKSRALTKPGLGDDGSQDEMAERRGAGERRKGLVIKQRIVKASRMPPMPEEHIKIVIRPRGGLNLEKVSPTTVGRAIVEAAGLTTEQTTEDVICPNFMQNILVASTPERNNAERYVRIMSIRVADKDFEVSAYETAPHTTCKGVIRNVDIMDGPATLERNIVNDRNPLAMAVKRIKNTGSVIIVFDGLRVPNFVRQRYQVPYVVRVRRQERARAELAAEQEAAEAAQLASVPQRSRGCSRSRSRSKSRRQSSSGTPAPRSRSVSIGGGGGAAGGRATWADKVKGSINTGRTREQSQEHVSGETYACKYKSDIQMAQQCSGAVNSRLPSGHGNARLCLCTPSGEFGATLPDQSAARR
ncbi:hypothetical protein HPB52_023446 [Rhipicephalus sanguineus]|uniref:Uncharacterized protein n=1 Tax=Rhipicephalus sanguineus TaxID=34632 RepID=A0A9D4Q4D3_RHISA|nr:hypothetical protein HPB52_023446 [Rhipicephalus sanguineus]